MYLTKSLTTGTKISDYPLRGTVHLVRFKPSCFTHDVDMILIWDAESIRARTDCIQPAWSRIFNNVVPNHIIV